MLTILKKVWHDPVWSKVIAGVVLGLLAAIFGTGVHFDWWHRLLGTYPIPVWLLALILLVVCIALAWLSRAAMAKGDEQEQRQIKALTQQRDEATRAREEVIRTARENEEQKTKALVQRDEAVRTRDDAIKARQEHEQQKIKALAERNEAIKARSERATVALKTLQGMMRAATRIRDQQMPPVVQPIKSFCSIRQTYSISKNFDTEVDREYEIQAVDKPIHFWGSEIAANAAADPVEYLDDMDFKMGDDSGREVVYLPTENDLRKKKIVVYFLPRIEPGEPKPRKPVMHYTWPGMLKQLEKEGQEDFWWSFESRDSIPILEFTFYLEPGWAGGNLRCEIAGPKYPEFSLVEITHPKKRWPGWIYCVKNAPPGRNRYGLTVRLRKP